MSVLRASSLAAVTTLVWSTRDRPICAAVSRTNLLTITTSGSATTGIVSLETTAINVSPVAVERFPKQVHPGVYVKCSSNPGEGHSEFDQRDGNCRLHPDDDGLGIEHTRHRCDIAEHAANKRVYDFKRGDIDEH